MEYPVERVLVPARGFYHDQNSASHEPAPASLYAELFLCIDAFHEKSRASSMGLEREGNSSALLESFVMRDTFYGLTSLNAILFESVFRVPFFIPARDVCERERCEKGRQHTTENANAGRKISHKT